MSQDCRPETESQKQAEYRKLPAVDLLLRMPEAAALCAAYGEATVTAAIRAELAVARESIAGGHPAPSLDQWPLRLDQRLQQVTASSLVPVINATGIIVHTNLGRAPLSAAARARGEAVGAGYSNLEYDLSMGRRGSRYEHARRLLCDLTGAEDALVVNNNAAALFLTLTGLCQGREVLIGRGELVEIGGGFRIPDVLRQSGCRLVEVGTTNRTYARDFADAVTTDTAAILRVHSSNFRQIGFVASPTTAELAHLAQDATIDGVPHPLLLIDDLGSGTLLDTSVYGLAPEPMVQTSILSGADVATFSGDKLLGGPQAGLIVGRREPIDILRRHPLARALRVGKLTLAALDATLRSYQRGRAEREVPVWRMIAFGADDLRIRATSWAERLAAGGVTARVIEGESAVGGGSLPGETLPTWLLLVQPSRPDAVAAALRGASTPVICRIQNDRLLFDPRTVLPEQDEELLATLMTTVPHG